MPCRALHPSNRDEDFFFVFNRILVSKCGEDRLFWSPRLQPELVLHIFGPFPNFLDCLRSNEFPSDGCGRL